MIIWMLAAAASAWAAVPFTGGRDSEVRIAPPRSEIPSPETLVYKVRWLGIPIGTGWIRIRKVGTGAKGRFVMTARTQANDFLMSFYPVKDTLKSLARAPGFEAVWSEKNLKEGRYRAHERVDFDRPRRMARFRSFRNGSQADIPLGGPVRDILGTFYWFRLQEAAPGQKVSTAVFADEKVWDFSVKILETQRLEIRNLGSFEVFAAEPEANFKGVLVNRGKVRVYFTADERRIPILIRLFTPYGPASGTLERIVPS